MLFKVEKILNKLYSYEYFGLWLMISIIVLIILFVVVLFLGKKDKKKREIEETNRLQQLNVENTFKEETKPQELEVNVPSENKEELAPTIAVTEQPIEQNIEMLEAPTINNVEEPVKEAPVINEVQEEIKPILTLEEEQPINLSIPASPVISEPVVNVAAPIKEEVKQPNNDLEPLIDEDIMSSEMEVPEFNLDSIINDLKDEIMSSENKEEETETKEEVQEEVKEKEVVVEDPTEDDFDLPTLKKDVQEDKEEDLVIPKIKDYNINDIFGESYDINNRN